MILCMDRLNSGSFVLLLCTEPQIRVYCRVKPHQMSSVKLMPDQCGLQIAVDGKDHSLEFDRVYGPAATQEQVRTLDSLDMVMVFMDWLVRADEP
jgi:hypothetical protein